MILSKPLQKWIGVFRGEVSPVLICLSVALGFYFGLSPGFYGLHVGLLIVALILNTHFGIFMLCAGLGKSLSFAAAPVLYHVGEFAQNNLSPLLGLLSDLPVVGITDFSRYAVAGAVIIGPVLGLAGGLLLATAVVRYRKTWLKLEQNSETFQKWRQKKWVQMLDRFLIGKSAQDVQATLSRRPKIVRRAGVVLALAVLVIAAVAVQFVTDDLLTQYAAKSLTDLNGAEVNIKTMSLQALSGKIAATGIQVTDPQNPQNNRLSIEKIEADVGLYGLLSGKIIMDNVSLTSLVFDQLRDQPGEVAVATADQQDASEDFDWGKFELLDADARTFETYFQNGQKIKETLAKIEPYLPKRGEAEKTRPAQTPQRYLEYLTARAPRAASPLVLVRRVEMAHVQLPFENLADSNIECLNLSDAPQAAGLPVSIRISSNTNSDWIHVLRRYDSPNAPAEVTAEFTNIDLAAMQERLSSKNPVEFKGGTASVKIEGLASAGAIDLTIKVQTENMELASAGGGALGLDQSTTSEAFKLMQNIETTLRLVGPIGGPKLVFDVPALQGEIKTALLSAGKDQLARRVGELVGDDLPIGQLTPENIDVGKIGDSLGGLLNKDAPEKDKESKNEKKGVKDVLGGLLGKDKPSEDEDE